MTIRRDCTLAAFGNDIAGKPVKLGSYSSLVHFITEKIANFHT